jgi:anti-sigma-K factor RskA
MDTVMVCNDCQELLSEYIDGALELGEQARIERHLADCGDCRAVRDDLLQITHFSHQLPMHTPSGAVWSRIQSEIASEQPRTVWARAARWFSGVQRQHFNLSIPQLAASGVALALVVSAAMMTMRQEPVAPGPMLAQGMSSLETNLLSNPDFQQYERQINNLKEAVERRKAEWNPQLCEAFERNMLYVDQSLVECRQQLNGNPRDKDSLELMLNAYREKVRLLEGFAGF